MIRNLSNPLKAGFVVVAAFLILNGVVSYRALNRVVANAGWVAHTHEVLIQLAETLSALKDAETGQRGYLLTQDEAYLQPYQDGRQSVQIHLSNVTRLVSDNPVQIGRTAELKASIDLRLEQLEQNIALQRTKGAAAVRDSILTGQGKTEMDHARSIVAAMSETERGYLVQRDQESAASIRYAEVSFIGASLLALLMVALAYVLLNRDLETRRVGQAALRAAHDRLEQRVIERTAELAEANIELEQEVTERKKTQDQLQLFTVELKRSNRELEDFAFVASHDLQEPLRKIQAFGDRMRTRFGESLSNEATDYLSRMQNAAERMHTLINDLLTFSRVRSHAQPFDEVDLNRVAAEVINDLEVLLQRTGGRVEVGALPVIAADPLQMRQLFQNLIGNALKFHRPEAPPVVTIRNIAPDPPPDGTTHEPDGVCQLEFADNGIGFEMKYLDRIFQPFQRLHARGVYAGTGMGLAVCRRIVERHQGEITAQSELGQGTVFVVTLPWHQDVGDE